MCDVAEQRAAGHRTLDTGTLDGIRRYDGDPGAGPGTRDRTSLSHALIHPACGGGVSTVSTLQLQQSGCCGDNEICFLPGPSSVARQSAAPCHGPPHCTSFLPRNQGADPHQHSTFNIDTILTSSIPYEFFLFLCRLGKIINRILV